MTWPGHLPRSAAAFPLALTWGEHLRTSDVDILMVPAPGDLDPDHWQARWQAKLSTARLVLPSSAMTAPLAGWEELLAQARDAARRPILFVAHGLGASAVVQAAGRLGGDVVRGAFLVAPPSEAALATVPGLDPGFLTYPRDPLPFPSVLVASRSAPHEYEALEDLSFAWGSRLLDAGEAGGINSRSGHGPWPEGLMSLAAFLKKL